MNTPWLALDVGAEVPGPALGVQGGIGQAIHLGGPGRLRLGPRPNRSVALIAHVTQDVGDEIHMLLDGYDHVAQHRRAARTGDGE